jgi:alkaline phosphatase
MRLPVKRSVGLLVMLLTVVSLTLTAIIPGVTGYAQAAPSGTAKNVILLIGDGMGYGQLTLGRIVKGSALTMDNFIYNGTVATHHDDPKEKWVTDSAAAATAIACGVKTFRGAIGVDVNKQPAKNILEIAQENGKATGLVTTTRVTHATPAAFAAHVEERGGEVDIAIDLLDHKINVLLGGGKSYFLPKDLDGNREDGRNLIEEAKEAGYNFIETKNDLQKVSGDKILGLFQGGYASYEIDRDPNKEPSVAEMTKKAIEVLTKDKNGFFLMVEGGRIDNACHDHDTATTVKDVLAFDEAVKVALDYAKNRNDTLVIVTADHETGGLSIGGYNEYNFNPAAFAGQKNSFREVVAKKLTADNYQDIFAQYVGINDLTLDERIAMLKAFKDDTVMLTAGEIVSTRAYTGWTTTKHTGNNVPVMAYGPKAQEFTGHLDNTDLFKLMYKAYGFKSKAALLQLPSAA